MTSNPNTLSKPVYGRLLIGMLALCAGLVAAAPAAHAQAGDQTIVDAREAFRKKDRNRLAALRSAAVEAKLPLALWTASATTGCWNWASVATGSISRLSFRASG